MTGGTTSSRLNLLWIVPTALGLASVLLPHWLIDDQYWQSVFVNAGTSLGLFALLAAFEPKLFGRLHGPRTLAEARQSVHDAIKQSPSDVNDDKDWSHEILEFIDPDRNETGITRFYVYNRTANECVLRHSGVSGLSWKLTRDGKRIYHEVSCPGLFGRVLKKTTRSDLPIQSRQKVFNLLCDIAKEFGSEKRAS